jgi:putative protein kinase ArgK-like GTPase of G3E family
MREYLGGLLLGEAVVHRMVQMIRYLSSPSVGNQCAHGDEASVMGICDTVTLNKSDLGKAWLAQFPLLDQEIVRQLLRSLGLVSHLKFTTGASTENASLAMRLAFSCL